MLDVYNIAIQKLNMYLDYYSNYNHVNMAWRLFELSKLFKYHMPHLIQNFLKSTI